MADCKKCRCVLTTHGYAGMCGPCVIKLESENATLQAKVEKLERDEEYPEWLYPDGVTLCTDGGDPEQPDCGCEGATCPEAVREMYAELERRLGEWEKRFPDHCYSCERRCLYAGTDDVGALRCAECLLRAHLAGRGVKVLDLKRRPGEPACLPTCEGIMHTEGCPNRGPFDTDSGNYEG